MLLLATTQRSNYCCKGITCGSECSRVSAQQCNLRASIVWCALMRSATCPSPALNVQDEVRALGRLPELNVPEAFITRHPFPGETLGSGVMWGYFNQCFSESALIFFIGLSIMHGKH